MNEKIDVNVMTKFKSNLKDFFFEKENGTEVSCLLEEGQNDIEESGNISNENEGSSSCGLKAKMMLDKCVSTEDGDDCHDVDNNMIKKVENGTEEIKLDENGRKEETTKPRFRFQFFTK